MFTVFSKTTRRLNSTLDGKRRESETICLCHNLIRLILTSQIQHKIEKHDQQLTSKSPQKANFSWRYLQQRALLFRIIETFTHGFLNENQIANLFRISLDRKSFGLSKSAVVRYVQGNWNEKNYLSDIAFLQLRSDYGKKREREKKKLITF